MKLIVVEVSDDIYEKLEKQVGQDAGSVTGAGFVFDKVNSREVFDLHGDENGEFVKTLECRFSTSQV